MADGNPSETKLQRIFKMFDEDGNGTIDSNELGTVLRALGLNPTEKEVTKCIEKIDTDNSGTIDYDEFKKFYTREEKNRPSPDIARAELIAAFKLFDEDSIGYLSADKLKNIMTGLGEQFTDEQCHDFLTDADTDGDGHVDYGEFVDHMLRYLELEQWYVKKKIIENQQKGKQGNIKK